MQHPVFSKDGLIVPCVVVHLANEKLVMPTRIIAHSGATSERQDAVGMSELKDVDMDSFAHPQSASTRYLVDLGSIRP